MTIIDSIFAHPCPKCRLGWVHYNDEGGACDYCDWIAPPRPPKLNQKPEPEPDRTIWYEGGIQPWFLG